MQTSPSEDLERASAVQQNRVTAPAVELSDVVVGRRLGGGNFGDVYAGTWLGNTPVALKKLKDQAQEREFLRESNTLKSLNHPNVVRFFGIYTNNDHTYIVTEFLSQGALDDLLRKNRETISLLDLLAISRDAAAGMSYLEEKKIVHRDLALRNLLADHGTVGKDRFIVKVGDLGLSRSMESGFYKNENATIPVKWSAPELLEYGVASTQSDVWSFGVTLWEIFAYGSPPYPNMRNDETVTAILTGYRMSSPEGCPTAVYELMQQCWASLAKDRPSFNKIYSTLYIMYNDEQSRTQSQK
jgi:serine/threonine protein kinase